MEHPVREISSLITTLTTGSPQQQKDTLTKFFLPNASFSHPFCRVPSFDRGSVPFFPEATSLWVLLCIYRWYRILSPEIDITIDSAVLDQRTSQLFVSIHQTFRIVWVPFYAARVRLVTVLDLEQRAAWSADETVSQDGVVEGSEPPPSSSSAGGGGGGAEQRLRYYIKKQEDLYQANDCLQFLLPGVGASLWVVWQLFSTLLCVVGAVLLLPVYYLANRNKRAKVA